MPSLDQLSFEFFREFSRCEYCLKAVGLRETNRKDPTADWGAFSTEVATVLETPDTLQLKEAIVYYLSNPPKKQVVDDDGYLGWKESIPDHQNQAELILRLVCRVRNNLFHGGKFNGHWFEPQRSEELLKHALIILSACVRAHHGVHEAYVQKAV